MTRNTWQRLSLFGLGIPAVVAAVFLLDFGRHVVFAALVCLILAFAAKESVSLFAGSGDAPVDPRPSIAAAMFMAISVYLACITADRNMSWSGPLRFGQPLETLAYSSTAAFLVMIGPAAFARRENAPRILRDFGARAFTHLYVGVLGSFLIVISSGFDLGKEAILSFLLVTFGNDSLAWLFGMTMGRTRNIVPMSPNKSVAGFAGGFLGSLAGAFIAKAVFVRASFPDTTGMVLWSLVIALSVIVGDLVESSMKRSAGVKDSGTIVPGRGGMLDSFDSLLFTAPVFVLFAYATGAFKVLG